MKNFNINIICAVGAIIVAICKYFEWKDDADMWRRVYNLEERMGKIEEARE